MKPGQILGALLGGIVITAGLAVPASANCVELRMVAKPAIHPTSSGPDQTAPIVGLWQFTFISEGNEGVPPFIKDGTTMDQGYAQWHSDGTEIMNSSRDPVTGNFCLGTWAATGRQTFRLNHFALSWDNTGTFCTPEPGTSNCFVGPTNIREEVIVNRRGDGYTGAFTIEQYDTAQHLMAHLTGRIVAHRINP
jgi:hypothetical protein